MTEMFQWKKKQLSSVTCGLQHPPPLALCRWCGYMVVTCIVLNVALVHLVSRHSEPFLHPHHIIKHEAGQSACDVFQVLGLIQPGTELSPPALVACAQCTVPLTQRPLSFKIVLMTLSQNFSAQSTSNLSSQHLTTSCSLQSHLK